MKKRGQSQYISWILIFAMIVVISYFLYNWSLNQARSTSEDLAERTDPIVCSEVGIVVEGICQTHSLIKMNITNSNNLNVDGLLLRLVGLYSEDDNYIQSETVRTDIVSGELEKFSVLKQGTLSQVRIIPYSLRDGDEIYCEDKSVVKDQNQLKQC